MLHESAAKRPAVTAALFALGRVLPDVSAVHKGFGHRLHARGALALFGQSAIGAYFFDPRDALIQDIDKLKRNAGQVAQDLRNHATAHIDERRHQIEQGARLQRFDRDLMISIYTTASGTN